MAGSGENYWRESESILLPTSEIKPLIEKVQLQRERLRKRRNETGLPTIAVVGYTNCGKTSLIKALTGDLLEPRNALFTTLDVTVHAGLLPNSLPILFLDTVGFISDIPTSLIASFSATLEDAVNADLLIHIKDASHPDV